MESLPLQIRDDEIPWKLDIFLMVIFLARIIEIQNLRSTKSSSFD